MEKGKRISCSNIAHLIVPDPSHSRKPPQAKGKNLHDILGYNENRHFIRDYEDLSLRGTPDRFNGSVIELKTFYYPEFEKIQERRGEIQLLAYGYISGNPNLELHLYDARNNLFTEKYKFEYDSETLGLIMDRYKLMCC